MIRVAYWNGVDDGRKLCLKLCEGRNDTMFRLRACYTESQAVVNCDKTNMGKEVKKNR